MNDSRDIVSRARDDAAAETAVLAPRQSYLGYGYPDEEEESPLRDYWRSVRRYLWLIVGFTLLVAAFASVYMARRPDIYQARSVVQVDLEANSGLSTTKGNQVVVSNTANDPAYFNTQLRVLTSSALLQRVVRTLDLEHNQAFLSPHKNRERSTWRNLQLMFALDSAKPKGSAPEVKEQQQLTTEFAPVLARTDLAEAERLSPHVESIRRKLQVDPVKESRLPNKETRLIEITFTHPDPRIAAHIVNTIVDTFALSNLEKRTETNTTAGDFLQRRVAELQSQIRNGEERLINYAASNKILSLDASQNTVVERLAGLNRQLLEAENDRKLAEADYQSSIVPGAAEALAEGSNKQTPDHEAKLAGLQQKRAELLVEITDEAPEVRAINDQIAVVEKQIADTRQRATSIVITNMETRFRRAQAREASLRQAFDQQRGETLNQNEAAINYRIIQQEVDTQKSLLNGLLQRSKENDVMLAGLAGTPNNIHVLDYALVPKTPVGPRRLLGAGVAFVFALALGVGGAVLLGYMDDSLQSMEEVEKRLHLPALAAVPVIGKVNRRLLPTFGKQTRNRTGLTPLVNDDPQSLFAEAYRQLRTSVLLSTAGHPPRILLVTSSQPAEGKTTTAINIALTLAQTGAKVLLIDADMHRPQLHAAFNRPNARGLSTALATEMDEAGILALIEQHEESNCHLLMTGPTPPNPAELLGSEQMRNLIATLEKSFTYIVIDSPPITYFTDSVMLTSVSDGVLLVVNCGRTSRQIVRRSRKILNDVGARIFGVVLNNVRLKQQDYNY